MKEKDRKNSKYLKYLVLFFIVVVFGIGALLWRSFPAGYYSSIAVTLGRYDYPFITSELQNQSTALVVRIGSRFPLALRRETLAGILDKQPQDQHSARHQRCEIRGSFLPHPKVESWGFDVESCSRP